MDTDAETQGAAQGAQAAAKDGRREAIVALKGALDEVEHGYCRLAEADEVLATALLDHAGKEGFDAGALNDMAEALGRVNVSVADLEMKLCLEIDALKASGASGAAESDDA